MAAFLFHLEFPGFTDEIASVIPRHREIIDKLFAEGKILSYSVSVNRNMVWCVINADDEQEAMELVLSFPLYPFFTEVLCHQLLFHNVLPISLPGISLN